MFLLSAFLSLFLALSYLPQLFKDSHAIYGNDVLTDEEAERYKGVFHAADESGDMLLDETEVHKLMVSSGLIHGQRSFVYGQYGIFFCNRSC